MTPLPDRIVGALALAPMTIAQLATCLTASYWSVRTAVGQLLMHGLVEGRGMRNRQDLYGLKGDA